MRRVADIVRKSRLVGAALALCVVMPPAPSHAADGAATSGTASLSGNPAIGAAAAKVWTTAPDYAPGSTALIGGSGFSPGEMVDLQVLHSDGRPSSDASHAPWTVVADAAGAIGTSWLVDPLDGGGSAFELTASGETSHATARTQFTDSGHPIWIFAHNPNSEFDVDLYLGLGVNALEPDIEYVPADGGLVIRHDTDISSTSHPLIPYLQHLSDLAGSSNLALVVFDVKSEAAQHAGAAMELANDVQTYLLDPHPEIHVIMSVATTDDANAFFPQFVGQPYNHAIAFQIDFEDNPKSEVDHLHQILGTDALIGYGDGTLGCCGRLFPLGPFVGPNVPVSLQQAAWVRASLGTLNMVSYGFAVTGIDTMQMLINSGVDGLIPCGFPVPPCQLPPLDTIDALSVVNSHYGGAYLATTADDPFSVGGAQNGVATGSRQGYGVEVQTTDGSGAGTDANITFTLHGDLGDASMTMDSSWSKMMEQGDKNYVFIPSPDLGRLSSITVEQDGTGGEWGNPLGLFSPWDVDYIKVRSFAYIGTDGVYPTPGDPNKSLYEYNADFGGQTIDDDTPVTVTLKSGIPKLATLTNGDLVLNMGPNAAAREGGDTSDGDESFTVHHVSTEPDGSETVTVSAFGVHPQTYKGVKQIHGDGGAGADTLTVDGAFTIPIYFSGGGDPGDALVLQNASFDAITHHFDNNHDGTVALDPDGPGGAPATLITYTGLAPITDNMNAANRVFDFAGASETITMSDDLGAVPGVSHIDSTLGESVDFTNPTSTMTVNASAGTGPDTINVQALDAAFGANTTINATDNGDHVTVEATAGATNRWTINGGMGADTFDVGSTPTDNNGDLDNIAGRLTVLGGSPAAPANAFPNTVDPTGQVDVLYLNDRGDGGKRNYRVGDFSNDGVDNPAVEAEPDSSGPARAFAGVSYDATMDYVRLDGTDDVNIFDVRPSLTTQYFIDGNLPPPGQCLKGGGDYLRLDTTGTTGRKLHITSPGAGFWSFTSGHRPVDFESIERFNHVDVLATAPDAGTSSPAVVKVYDAETGEFLYQVSPFETSFKGGVRVATGDLNCDGLPDLIVAPGPGMEPTVKIYDGSLDANGDHPAGLLTSFAVSPTSFKGGVNLAVGDVNADGYNDLVVGSDTGGPPRLLLLDGQYLLSTHALLGPPLSPSVTSFTGGVNVAAGDINNDGYADIVAVSGAGTTTTVKVFSGNGLGLVKTFTPFGRGLASTPAAVAVGDFNGDGVRDVVVGGRAGGIGTVSVFSGSTNFAAWPLTPISSFQPYGSGFQNSVRVVVKPTNGGNPGSVEKVNILTAPGPGGGSAPPLIRQASFAGSGSPPLIVDKLLADPTYNALFIG
jgi:FG-GAP-like repeat/PLAT/LH2 domain/FG-GAP repeat